MGKSKHNRFLWQDLLGPAPFEFDHGAAKVGFSYDAMSPRAGRPLVRFAER